MASKQEIIAFLTTQFPQSRCVVDEVVPMGATVSMQVGTEDLRPGGTVSGPTLMALADLALYVAILGEIGIVPLAVTTSLTINFLRKPEADRRVVGVCKILKLGKTLAVGEVSIYTEQAEAPVAHAVATYSIPRLT